MKWFFSIFFSCAFVFLFAFGTNCIYGYLFPIKYFSEISEACELYDVEQPIVFSVINIESRFKKKVVSSKGAVGLMQIMPQTAVGLSSELEIEKYDLNDVQDNITLGTYYLSQLLQRFEVLETALASYNAGPTNVSSWLKNSEYSDDGKTLKKIPFPETDKYLQKFRQSFKYYNKKLS